jgi:hypothetical protein
MNAMSASALAIEKQKSELEAKINKRIIDEGKDWHPLQYRHKAEAIASEMAGDLWEWVMLEKMGRLPQIAFVGYRGD